MRRALEHSMDSRRSRRGLERDAGSGIRAPIGAASAMGPGESRSARPRGPQRLGGLLALLLLVAALPGRVLAEEATSIALDRIEKGALGYGLSVFEGTETERFEVEAIGLLRGSSPQLDYLLVRLSGQNLETSGVIAGMSGSPVYFDGKLAGAVAFAWPFSHQAIGGVTPIGEMREIRASSRGGATASAGASRFDPARLLAELDPEPALARALAPLTPPPLEGNARSGVVWSAGGFSGLASRVLEGALGSLAPVGSVGGGSGAADPQRPLAGGDAVAAVLVDGDFSLAATGTVTEVRGDRVFAFGHPFLSLGGTSLPMARAEILTVLSSLYSSFKLSNTGPIVGAFDADLRAGIAGTLGAEAPMLPVAIHVVGGGLERRLAVRVARIPLLSPVLAAVSLLSAQEAVTGTFGVGGVDLEVRFELAGRDDLVLRQSFDGANAGQQAAVGTLQWLSFVLDNGFAELDLRSVEVDARFVERPRTATLIGGWADRSRVEPGERVTLSLEMAPWRDGEIIRHQVEVIVPDELPAGRYILIVGDGSTLDGVRLAVEKPAPQRIEQALRIVSRFHSRRDLVVLGLVPAAGLSVDGEVLPNLPGSVQAIWSGAGPQSATRLGVAVVQELVEELDQPLDGAVRIDLEVIRRSALDPASLDGGIADAAESPGAQSGASSGSEQSGAAQQSKDGRKTS